MTDGDAPGYFPVFDHIAARKDLSPNAKMLYGLLYNLSRREGYAWASNSFLAERLGLENRQVRRVLSDLAEARLIKTRIENNTSNVHKRRIYLASSGVISDPTTPVRFDPTNSPVIIDPASENLPLLGEAISDPTPGQKRPGGEVINDQETGQICPGSAVTSDHQIDNLNKPMNQKTDEKAKPKTRAPAQEPLDSPGEITQPSALASASARLVRKSLSTCELEFASLPDEKKRGYFDTAESDLAGLGISPGKLPPAAVERRAISLYMTEQNTQSATGA